MARQGTSKRCHFGLRPSLMGHGSRARCDVKSRTWWFCKFAYLLVSVGKCWESSSEKMLARCVVGCSTTANVQEVLRFMPYHFMERWSSWREETYKAMGRFRESEMCKVKAVWVWWSALSISNKMISLDAWIFRESKGFCWFYGLSETNLE